MTIKQIFQKLKASGELSKFNYATSQGIINNTILNFIKKKKLILHGAKALNAQSHFPYQRSTKDFDIFTKTNPKLTAHELDRLLDKARSGNYHYVRESRHKGTHQVMDVGADLKKGTEDDFNLADLTRIPRKKYSTVEVNQMLYAHLDELQKAKERTLKFKKYGWRYKKDKADLQIIKKLKGGMFWI